jgi:N12 class adenine-specific DNA methylase
MKYYEFSFRGFANETVLVKFDNQQIFSQIEEEFYDRYPNAKVWNVKAKDLTKKQREQAFINHWGFDANDYNLQIAHERQI